jgi:hypothetical protein
MRTIILALALLAAAASSALAQTTTPSSTLTLEQFLVGSWAVTRTPASTTGATPTQELLTFVATGEALESRPAFVAATPSGPALETPGHGAWDLNDAGVFVVTLVALVQAAPNNTQFTTGQSLGSETLRMQLNVNVADGTLTGTFTSEARNVGGAVTGTVQGNVQGTRIVAQPATGATSTTTGGTSTTGSTTTTTTPSVFGTTTPQTTNVFGMPLTSP